jgi:predicted  nucleic acid-binding Zn-ribbon protein
MIFWLPDDCNIHEVQVLYEIETVKAEISYAEIGINNLLSKISVIEYNMAVLKSNIEYLQKNAIIVSIREYIKINYQLAALIEQKIEKEATLKDLRKKKNELQKRLELLSVKLEQVKFKVLEFKKRG